MRTPFRRLLAASGASKFGDGLIVVGLPLYTAAVTHGSVMAVALMAFVVRLPWLLLALPAGAYADRRPFRQTMIVSDLARFALVAVLAVLVVLDAANLPVLLVIGFGLGAFDTLFTAAESNALPAVVSEEGLARASGRCFAVEASGEQVVGPTAAGLLYSVSPALPFVGDAASFLASAALLRTLPAGEPVVDDDAAPTSLGADMRDGLRHFTGNRMVRVLTGVVASWSFAQALAFALLVLFATDVLGLSARMFGVLLAVTSVMNVLGGLLADRVWAALGTLRLLVLTGAATAVVLAVCASTSSPVVAAVCLGVEALLTPCGIVATGTLRMQAVGASVRGKVMNLSRTMIIAAAALGSLLAGPLAGWSGLRAPLYVGALVYAVTLAVSLRSLRSVLPTDARADVVDAPADLVAA